MTLSRNVVFATCAALIGLSSIARADQEEIEVVGFSSDPLVVYSNGQKYTHLTNNGVATVRLRFFYDTEVSGRVKSWKTWPRIINGVGYASEIEGMEDYAYSKTYQWNKRPKKVNRTVPTSFPAARLAEDAVLMCNYRAQKLRDQGKSNQQIFSEDREVHFLIYPKYRVDASGPSLTIFTANPDTYPIKIRCAKWQGSKIPQAGNGTLQAPSHVRRAKLTLAEVANQAGACAVKLTTKISTNLPNVTVKYRYEHSNGKKSKVFTTKTGANKVAVTTRQWDVPNGKGPEVGAVRVIGVSHDFTTHIQNYDMKCVDGPGGFAANPVEIRKATMKLREIATRAGACGLKLTTAISTNKPGATIKYRYVHSSGKKSKVFTTKTAQNKIAVVTHQWDVPNRKGTERGRIKLVGVSPKFSSNLSNYSMNCVDAPRGLRATPGKPKVRIPLGSNRLKN